MSPSLPFRRWNMYSDRGKSDFTSVKLVLVLQSMGNKSTRNTKCRNQRKKPTHFKVYYTIFYTR